VNQELIGKEEVVLIEGTSKKSEQFLSGRTDSNKVVILPKEDKIKEGDYVKVKINRATSGTLFGDFISFANIIETNLSLTG
jgi:tRNA-2-methylthio-N6-dimethylallyladenosine synthase